MSGEKDLNRLVKKMKPRLNPGEFVFASVPNPENFDQNKVLCQFKEAEGTSIIIDKNEADQQGINYEYVASWITLTVHSSLEAVGLTAIFSGELAKHNISCNVVAGYYHDHIFIDQKDANSAIEVLLKLSH